jgi:hypothetical protein
MGVPFACSLTHIKDSSEAPQLFTLPRNIPQGVSSPYQTLLLVG